MVRKSLSAFHKGFTLVEVMVASLLVAIALAGVMGGISSLTKADTHARDAVLVQQLAAQKMREFEGVTDPTTAADKGDFTDQGHPEVSWTLTVETGGVTNIEKLSVTATKISGNKETAQTLIELVYIPPATTGGTQ